MGEILRRLFRSKALEFLAIGLVSFITGFVIHFPISLPGHVLGRINSDFYQSYLVMNEWQEAVRHGTPPVSIYWVHGLYGGGPAYYYFLPNIPTVLIFLFYQAVGDYFVALKLVLWLVFVIAGLSAYRYFNTVFKEKDAALLAVISYLSLALFHDMWHGHLHVIFAAALSPWVMAEWDRLLRSPDLRRGARAGIAYFVMMASELQITLFTSCFMVFRLAYVLLRRRGGLSKQYLLSLGRSLGVMALISSCAIPLALPFITFYRISYTSEPITVFSVVPFTWVIPPSVLSTQNSPYYYLGIVPLLTVAYTGRCRSRMRYVDEFTYHVVALLICMVWASQGLMPYILSKIPLLRSIRAHSRVLILGAFYTSVLYAIAYATLVRQVREGGLSFLPSFLRSDTERKKLFVLAIMALAVMMDAWSSRITIPTSHVYTLDEAYDYVRSALRGVEARAIVLMEDEAKWSISDYAAGYVGRDCIGATPIGLPCYPGEYQELPGLNSQILSVLKHLIECKNALAFIFEATLYGVKYVIVDRSYGPVMDFLDSIGFICVLMTAKTAVYKNPYFMGMVFALSALPSNYTYLTELRANAQIYHEWEDHNTLRVNVFAVEPCVLVVSYIYHGLWEAQVDGSRVEIGEYRGVMFLRLGAGGHHIVLHFRAYEEALPLFVAYFTIPAASALLLVAVELKGPAPSGEDPQGDRRGRRRKSHQGDIPPGGGHLGFVILICVHNEGWNIRRLLYNLLYLQSLDPHYELKGIIVVSSGSRDDTNSILREVASREPKVIPIIEPERSGKSHAVNMGLDEARKLDPDVIVFVAGDVVPKVDCLNKLLRTFEDPEVGCAISRPIPLNRNRNLIGNLVYVLWDMHHEMNKRGFNKVTGECFAVRASATDRIPEEIINDDLYIEYLVYKKGYRFVYVPEALVYIWGPTSLADLYEQRKRVNLGHLQLKEIYKVRHMVLRNLLSLVPTLLTKYRPVDIFLFCLVEAFSRLMAYVEHVRRSYNVIWKPIRTSKGDDL